VSSLSVDNKSHIFSLILTSNKLVHFSNFLPCVNWSLLQHWMLIMSSQPVLMGKSPLGQVEKLRPKEEIRRLKREKDVLILELAQLRQHGHVTHQNQVH
jgi:hypothetical protein